MATPTRYDVAIYDDPSSVYEQAWLNQTENDDTVSSTAWTERLASVTYTEAGDTLTASADLFIEGSVTYTEGNDTLTSTALLLLQGSVNYLEDDDTFSSTTLLEIHASANYTEDDDTFIAYILRLPWGGTTGSSGIPYDENSGTNPNGPYGHSSSGVYDRPYEEN